MLSEQDEAIASVELELLSEGGIVLREDEGRVAWFARDLRYAARVLIACRAGQCVHGDERRTGVDCRGLRAYVRREHGDELVVRWGPCARRRTAELTQKSGELLEASRMPTALRAKTLDDFKSSPANEAAYKAVRRAVNDPSVGLMLAGPHRVGKTHLAAAAVNARIRTGRPAIFVVVADLLKELRMAKGKDDQLIDLLIATPLLVLDDLAAERPTDFALEMLFLVVNGRMNQHRQTIVTTNLETPEALQQALAPSGGDRVSVAGRRVAERLGQLCSWIVVGEDLELAL